MQFEEPTTNIPSGPFTNLPSDLAPEVEGLRNLGEVQMVLRHLGRYEARARPPQFVDAPNGGGVMRADAEQNQWAYEAQLAEATGIADPVMLQGVMRQLSVVTSRGTGASRLNEALSMLAALDPRNESEAMLAAQMVATHVAAMEAFGHAAQVTRIEHQGVYLGIANKLLRTYATQADTLARLRGKSSNPSVRVGRVQVEAGGQAVVGVVRGEQHDNGK